MKVLNTVLLLLLLMLGMSCQDKHQPAAIPSTELAIEWNQLTYEIAYAHDEFYSFIGVRALAMVHIAMHDALNAIDTRYQPYAFKGGGEGADPEAAVAQSAYEVLLKIYPQREDTLQELLARHLSAIPHGSAKDEGIKLGKQSAAAIIALRQGDGHDVDGSYAPMSRPGSYQYTPGFDWVLIPDFERIQPFFLKSVDQFRSPAPPPLSGAAYAEAYREVKALGKKDSPVRTADQTHYAHWWAEFAEHSWNRIGRLTAAERKLGLWETARLFALINMNIYDTYIASLESKYHYDTWRPYTAIRAADTDGNPITEADTLWEPEMLTPPWPEYPSAHAAVGAGGAAIVDHVYGTPEVAFRMESVSALPDARVRSYNHLDTAALYCAESRIMNGYHFRFATEEGLKQGRRIAQYLLSEHLQPVEQ